MNTKLTLSLEESLIKKAKNYAKTHNTSLSKIVERFFSNLQNDNKRKDRDLSPVVKELSGIIDLGVQVDHKKLKESRLIKKYL